MLKAHRGALAFTLAFGAFALAPSLAWAEALPTVTSITPSTGGSGGGQHGKLKGTEFTGAVTTGGVKIGAASLKKITTGTLAKNQFKILNNTEIEVDTPALEHGTDEVTVTNTIGESSKPSPVTYTYVPEFFRNEAVISSVGKIPFFGDGALTLQTPLVENTETHVKSREVEIECINLMYGDLANEGTEVPRAVGQIQEWWMMGHTPTAEFTEVSPLCRFTYLGAPGGEAWVTAERPLHAITQNAEVCINPESELEHCPKKIGEPGDEREIKSVVEQVGREQLTTPWNTEVELTEGKTRLKIGVPTEGGKSCNEEPAPPGCVRLTIIYPALNLFFPFEGSIEPRWIDGVGNGLSPSSLEFEGEASGHIHAAGTPESLLSVSGAVKVIGAEGRELMTVK
jgi:hypothetical protein